LYFGFQVFLEPSAYRDKKVVGVFVRFSCPLQQARTVTCAARISMSSTARAAFFPSISLTGSAGFASSSLDGLFTDGPELENCVR
jgi:hypothetical protein